MVRSNLAAQEEERIDGADIRSSPVVHIQI